MTYDDRLRPRRLELAAGLMLGPDDSAQPLPESKLIDPVVALRLSLRGALQHSPCTIAFSGGRDSSGLLAMAVDVARREGLPDPLPVTMRFPGVPQADETAWQEAVIRHLGVKEWDILTLHDELDYVGPYAQRVLRRHGVLWPANTHVDLLLLEHARGGCMVDGVDGDSILSWGHLRLFETLKGRRRPGRSALRNLRDVALGRKWRHRQAHRRSLRLPWLTGAAQAQLSASIADEVAAEPLRFDRRVRWYHGSRYLGALQWTTHLLAAETGTAVVRPLLDPDFLSSLGSFYGRFGFRGRTEAMRVLFGDLLPDAVLARSSKASFPHYWGEQSGAAAMSWSGAGVDPEYVNHDALRRAWAEPRLDHRSALLLQAAWLADQ